MPLTKTKSISILILVLTISGCAVFPPVSQKLIAYSTSYDESQVTLKSNTNCNYEDLIRTEFPNYRIHNKSKSEIWFFDFKEIINTTNAGNFYLMEVFIIDYNDQTNPNCSVKYFSSFEKRPNKIQNTDKSGGGIAKLRQTLKHCDNGR